MRQYLYTLYHHFHFLRIFTLITPLPFMPFPSLSKNINTDNFSIWCANTFTLHTLCHHFHFLRIWTLIMPLPFKAFPYLPSFSLFKNIDNLCISFICLTFTFEKIQSPNIWRNSRQSGFWCASILFTLNNLPLFVITFTF